MKKISSIFVLFGILAILIISGCTQQQPAVQPTPAKETPTVQPTIEQPTVKLSAANYIVDDKGNTLYFYTKDVMGDSKCTGNWLNSWPVFCLLYTSPSP